MGIKTTTYILNKGELDLYLMDFPMLNFRMCILTHTPLLWVWTKSGLPPLGQSLFLEKQGSKTAQGTLVLRKKKGQICTSLVIFFLTLN